MLSHSSSYLGTVEHVWSLLVEDDGLSVDIPGHDARDDERGGQDDGDHDGAGDCDDQVCLVV